jgi:hypothetical protein
MLKYLNHCLKRSSEIFVLHDCFNFAHALGNCLPAALRPCRGLLAAFFFAPLRKVRTHFGKMVDSHTRFFGTSKFLSRSDCGRFTAMKHYGGYRWTIWDYVQLATELRPLTRQITRN